MVKFIDFQSHSVTHPILPMCDDNKALYEIKQSKIFLEQEYGFCISSFAYPNGDFTSREKKILKKSGYLCGVSGIHGYNKKNDDFRLQ